MLKGNLRKEFDKFPWVKNRKTFKGMEEWNDWIPNC